MLLERKLFKHLQPYIHSKEALIITGMRRTGKTSLLRFLYDRIPSKNKLFLDLENPLNQKYFEEANYDKIKSSLEFLGLDFSRKPLLFLDEIQLVKSLPRIMKYLIDHYRVKFFLTGSASFYLKNLFTESLAGRKYIFELFPLDFEEFLLFKKSKLILPDKPGKISRPIFDAVSVLYDEYLYFGGFPEVVLKKTLKEKKKSLEDIFTSYFQMEVLRFGDYRRNEVVRDLMILLLQRAGSKLDVQKMASELGVSRLTLNEYISFLEGTYFIARIRPFSRNKDLELRKMPKVYVCDSGLANNLTKIGEGSLFENNVFQNLRIKGGVHYYQKKSGVEIDFIVNKETAIEVKTSAAENDLKRLKKISSEIGLKKFKIITRSFSYDFARAGHIGYGFML